MKLELQIKTPGSNQWGCVNQATFSPSMSISEQASVLERLDKIKNEWVYSDTFPPGSSWRVRLVDGRGETSPAPILAPPTASIQNPVPMGG